VHAISVPRDTMVTLQMYTEECEWYGMEQGQITLQYAYGDGQNFSAEQMAKQVSSVLFNIPINGYLAINTNSLWILNEEVGGVDITMDADYTMFNPLFEEGATVHLHGNIMENYIRGRDKEEAGSAYTRMHRIKQYVLAFYDKAVEVLKHDFAMPIRVLNRMQGHMATDVTIDEIVYLLTQVVDCSFSTENIYTLPGEIIRGEKYEEYYLDQVGVAEIVINLLYEPIE